MSVVCRLSFQLCLFKFIILVIRSADRIPCRQRIKFTKKRSYKYFIEIQQLERSYFNLCIHLNYEICLILRIFLFIQLIFSVTHLLLLFNVTNRWKKQEKIYLVVLRAITHIKYTWLNFVSITSLRLFRKERIIFSHTNLRIFCSYFIITSWCSIRCFFGFAFGKLHAHKIQQICRKVE